MTDILTLFREGWLWLLGAVCTLVTFIYLSDKRSIDRRFGEMGDRVLKIENDYIGRTSVETMVNKVEEKFQREHENIIDVVNQRHKEVMERLTVLDDRIVRIIGLRDSDQ